MIQENGTVATPRRNGHQPTQSAIDKQIIDSLDIRAEFIAIGVEFTGQEKEDGWCSCYAVGREDNSPSAGGNLKTGRYKDFAGENLSFFDFAAKYSKSPTFASWREARDHYAAKTGVPLPKGKRNPFRNLQWVNWNDALTHLWILKRLGQKAIDRGVTPAILQALGCRLARYRRQYTVLAMPVFGVGGVEKPPKAYVLWNITSGPLPVFKKGQSEPISWVKMKSIGETGGGLLGAHGVERLSHGPATVWKLEGATDLIALFAAIPEAERESNLVVANAGGSCEHVQPGLAALFAGHPVYIIHDSDTPGVQGASGWARALADVASEVKVLALPYPVTQKHGKDTRDFLFSDDHEYEDLFKLAESTALANRSDHPPDNPKLTDASKLDPATEATAFLDHHQVDGLPSLRHHRNCPQLWKDGRYLELDTSEMQAELILHINRHSRGLTTGITANILAQVRAQSIIPSATETPAWLDAPPVKWKPEEILATRNALIHLPSLISGSDYSIPSTPRYYSHTALDYDFDIEAPVPERWLQFLQELWPNDSESIATLQEWFGYLLTSDTSQQKILVMVGPTRGGKGVIIRVLTELLGRSNIASPTLASFQENFGIGPLLHASVGIIADARLGNRANQSKIVERLLSISGEDPLTVDRKFRDPITSKIPARLMIISNELPRLAESSGALSARMIVLRLTQTWLGKEDSGLTAKLLRELPGILLWAVRGYDKLSKRGHFVQPESGLEMVQDLADLSSPVGKFIRDRCEIAPGQEVSVDDIFEAWKEWCKDNGREHAGTKLTFCRDLRAVVPNLKTVQHREITRRVRYYEGIGLN